MIFGVTEPISDDLSTVLLPHDEYVALVKHHLGYVTVASLLCYSCFPHAYCVMTMIDKYISIVSFVILYIAPHTFVLVEHFVTTKNWFSYISILTEMLHRMVNLSPQLRNMQHWWHFGISKKRKKKDEKRQKANITTRRPKYLMQ